MKFFSMKDSFSNLDKDSDLNFIEINDAIKVEMRKIQLDMLKEIYQICRKERISIMLGGGSLLGAIRHKGFIPWDDDIDLMLTRENFNKLLLVQNKFSSKYKFLYSLSGNPSFTTFAKIINTETTYIEIGTENIPREKGIFIDLFIIENIPNNKMKSFFHGIRCNYMQFVANSLILDRFQDKDIKIIFFRSLKGKLNYILRKFISKLYFFKDIESYFFEIDNYFGKYKNTNSKFKTIPSGRKHYFGEILPSNIFENLIEVKFEDLFFGIPKDYHVYLKNLYGEDYMKIPPESKREKHYCIKLELNND